MFEYFLLLEFARPFIILLAMRDEALALRERLLKVFKACLPYVGAIVFAFAYRSLVYTHPGFGYSLTEEIARAHVREFYLAVREELAAASNQVGRPVP